MSVVSPQDFYKWSVFVERECQRFPDLLDKDYQTYYQENVLIDLCQRTLESCEDETALKRELRRLRREQMVRIAVRDLAGLADLNETMRDVSDLAEGLVSAALDWWMLRFTQRFGQPIGEETGEPQKLIILGMGKLGGRELNFSSDIDLIYLYEEKGYTDGKKYISNDEFFSKLGLALNKSLTELTSEGMVYRVDMRLRPFGEVGPLAISFAGAEHYYEVHGRAWERYALVKARAIAGDKNKAKTLFDILRPFVYRRYVDYTAMDSLRDLKRMIAAEVRKKGMENNLKLGRGGIREIEFIVQAFQLVHGGRDKPLQAQTLLPILSYLADQDYIAQQDADNLREAYVFLRRAENRIQEWGDQQAHSLPDDIRQQKALAEAMGFQDYSSFIAKLEQFRETVQHHFDDVFAEEADVCDLTDALSQAWKGPLEDDALIVLTQFGFHKPGDILNQLRQFKKSRAVGHMSAEATTRLEQVMPLLLKQLASLEAHQEIALQRTLSVIENVVRRSVYLVLLKENPVALMHLIKLCAASAWLTDLLVKYPALMDQLLDLRSLYRPLKLDELLVDARTLLSTYQDDEEQFMLQLRHWRHAQVFKVAAADITGQVPVMHVSDYLTWIAEAVLNVAHDYVWQQLTSKHGLPGGQSQSPFLILGYGKLGGIELGYGSDLDIVFLYDLVESGGKTQPQNDRQRVLENGTFFMRLGQKIISVLTSMMPAGQLYEVDTRLRPNGDSGLMVTTLKHFEHYQQDKAWNWEHQALIRARAVVGESEVCQNFENFRAQFLSQPRLPEKVKIEVVEMRNKMRRALDKSTEFEFDIKHGRGGIVDIEFMVQYLVLAYANQQPGLVKWPDNMRILDELKDTGLLENKAIEQLQDHYRTYRGLYHKLALQNQKALVDANQLKKQRDDVIKVWNHVMP